MKPLVKSILIDPRLFLKIAFLIIFMLVAIPLFLPKEITGIYSVCAMLIALFTAFLLSFKAAFIYERELRKAFFYLASFLLFLFLANLRQFWDILYAIFGPHPFISLIIAVIAYVFLLIACANILKVTDIADMHKKEWLAIFLLFVMNNYIIIYLFLHYRLDFSVEALTMLLFRIMDNVIVLMLLPTLFVYRKQSKKEKKESITFTIVILGIIISTIGDYVYEIITKISYHELSAELHTGTLLDLIFIFSYLLIALGLFVHLNYYKWIMGKIDIEKLDLIFE